MQVIIEPGCIACGVCESLCPEVFSVLETSTVDASGVSGRETACRDAAKACPVSVIAICE